MTIEIRATAPDEFRSASNAVSAALMGPPWDDEQWEVSLPSWHEMPSFCAWDGEACVGTAGQFIVDTVVPGGARLPTGAVSRVGVLPTHRRRRIASRLMRDVILDADRRGLVLQSLHASDARIYERFGFGLSTEFMMIEFDPRRATPIRGATSAGSLRLLSPEDTDRSLPDLYERVGRRRVGSISRCASWWHRITGPTARKGKASFVVVHSDDDGNDDGFAHYVTAWDDDHREPNGNGELYDLFGTSDAVELALWQYICDVDLVTRWRAETRPIDDPFRFAAHDVRARRVRTVDDELWLRIVDVDIALSSRTYAPVAEGVHLHVPDPVLAGNDGTWRISGDGAARAVAAPDIVTGIAGLSAAYLGGTSWRSLVASDRATEATPGAVDLADALFAITPLPYCGSMF